MKHIPPTFHRIILRSVVTVALHLVALTLPASPLAAAEENRAHSIRTMHKGLPLKQKVDILQGYIEAEHFGQRTIPICMPHDDGPTGKHRAWEVADFEDQSIPHFWVNKKGEPPRVTGADWINNENSASFSGEYLLSQVFRFEATKDPAALAECKRAVRAIQAISSLAGPERFGWICKPWGGKLQDSSSPDQNICAAVGLYCFLPYADSSQADWIRKLIPAIAAYWERVEYHIEFGDHLWDVRKNVSHMRIYTTLNRMAHELTHDAAFKTVADRLEAKYGDLDERSASLFDTYESSHPGSFSQWRKCTEFAGATLLFAPWQLHVQCTLHPEKKPQYLAAWQRVLRHGLLGYDRAYAGHHYRSEVTKADGDFTWRPVQTVLPTLPHDDLVRSETWAFLRYTHRIYWLDATARLPMAYLMYLKQGGTPLPDVESAVRDVMEKLDFDRLHWMTDPGHDQAIPEIRYMLRAMTSESPNYLSAYHLGQQIGFWK